jgi:hypothetical protein
VRRETERGDGTGVAADPVRWESFVRRPRAGYRRTNDGSGRAAVSLYQVHQYLFSHDRALPWINGMGMVLFGQPEV